MKTQHTAGEWHPCRFGIEIKPGDQGHEILATVGGVHGVQIAVIPVSGNYGMMRPDGKGGSEEYASYRISKAEALANLRLLAAAPKLLAALERLAGCYSDSRPPMLWADVSVKEASDAWQTARAAIASARGQS
jgi:hypothetical protein